MTRIPPLLPEEVLNRVLRLARFDGMGVLVVAGLFSLLAAVAGDASGAIIGLLIAGAGAIELHGAGLLQHGDTRGMNWLIFSQLFLLALILGYCAYRVTNVDFSLIRASLTPELKAQIAATGMGMDEFLHLFNRTVFAMVATLTVIYQGGMTLYYLRRREAVARALAE